MSRIAVIGDDIVTVLAAAFIGENVEIRRTYVPERWLHEMPPDQIVIDVVPRTVTGERLTRAGWQWTVTYDIGVRSKLSASGDADDVLEVAERVATTLQAVSMLPATRARLIEVEHNPVASPDHLAEYGVLTSVVSVSYLQDVPD